MEFWAIGSCCINCNVWGNREEGSDDHGSRGSSEYFFEKCLSQGLINGGGRGYDSVSLASPFLLAEMQRCCETASFHILQFDWLRRLSCPFLLETNISILSLSPLLHRMAGAGSPVVCTRPTLTYQGRE